MPGTVAIEWNSHTVKELVDRLEVEYGVEEWHPRYSPMDELVSCILSQHTNDLMSYPTFEHMRRTFPTWQDVVDAGEERLAEVIKKAGLSNQKAKSIIACLRGIYDRVGAYSLDHLDAMPPLQARAWLEELPGVGPKTASLVLCFALGKEIVPVDTHIFRVSWRLGLIEKQKGEGKAHDILLGIVPAALAFRYHMTLIKHGRAVCKAPTPRCDACAIKDMCAWYTSGAQEQLKGESKTRKRLTPKS